MKRQEWLLGATLFLSACGLPTMVKPGGSEPDFARDDYECRRDAELAGFRVMARLVMPDAQEFYQRCMEARGYRAQ